MTVSQPSWIKDEMICHCTKKFKPQYRNGILVSHDCPNCRLQAFHKPKGVVIASELNKPAKSKETKRKTGRQRAMNRADEWFSRYIRLKYSFESGGELYCKCYTCNRPKPIFETENGHWQRRGYKTTRFHPNDARPQCNFCNQHRSGEPEKFEINLINEIGIEKVTELKKLSQQLGEDNEPFYREQAAKYRLLFNMLLKERNIKSPWK
jgi:hypothetical protein